MGGRKSSSRRRNIKSSKSLTGLSVKIVSEALSAEELSSVGLASEIDLLNPGGLEDALKLLGFLPLDDPYLMNISFTITNFIYLYYFIIQPAIYNCNIEL